MHPAHSRPSQQHAQCGRATTAVMSRARPRKCLCLVPKGQRARRVSTFVEHAPTLAQLSSFCTSTNKMDMRYPQLSTNYSDPGLRAARAWKAYLIVEHNRIFYPAVQKTHLTWGCVAKLVNSDYAPRSLQIGAGVGQAQGSRQKWFWPSAKIAKPFLHLTFLSK